ncbi:MAG: HNH endonuclease [Bacteroidia bacterium]|nr:HNH endonuclease [Bacteroidia bacterium]
MKGSVLVLNQDFQAISVCSVERAFVLVFLKKAELLHEDPEKKIHTVNRSYQFPSIIRLYRYVRIPYRRVSLTRINIFKRDQYECVYCGSRQHLTIDHLIPKSLGGKDTWENLVTACSNCNTKKGNLTLEEAGLQLRRKPYKPSHLMFLREFSDSIQESWRPFLYMS